MGYCSPISGASVTQLRIQCIIPAISFLHQTQASPQGVTIHLLTEILQVTPATTRKPHSETEHK